MVDKAKSPLWATGQSINEIAYDLVFEHPFHFTNKSSSAFRNLN